MNRSDVKAVTREIAMELLDSDVGCSAARIKEVFEARYGDDLEETIAEMREALIWSICRETYKKTEQAAFPNRTLDLPGVPEYPPVVTVMADDGEPRRKRVGRATEKDLLEDLEIHDGNVHSAVKARDIAATRNDFFLGIMSTRPDLVTVDDVLEDLAGAA